MLALLTLLACKQPDVVVVGGRHTELTVRLVDPTGCPQCDPFRGVDTLRVEVWRDGALHASDSFAYPDEAPELPDLEGFGVVRIAMVGLGAGRVISAGRTPEIALVPDAEMEVPMTFLPANEAIPLAAPMRSDRMHHAAARLPDGSVLLLGGTDAAGARTWSTMERYDPVAGSFEPVEATLPAGVASPRVAWHPDGELFVVGGFTVAGGDRVPVQDAAVIDGADATVTELPPLVWPRAGHCFALYRDRLAITLGGNSETNQADYLHPAEGTGEWEFLGVTMADFDQTAVTACTTLPDGRVFVQGAEEGSTGLYAHIGEESPAEVFRTADASSIARYPTGPMAVTLADGTAWVGGGADEGQPSADTRVFNPDGMRFAEGVPLERPRVGGQVDGWIAEDWAVVGCGWGDADHLASEDSVEVRSLPTGEAAPLVEFDRPRPGCTVTTLTDGSVLIAGGYDGDAAAGADAALFVPWVENLR